MGMMALQYMRIRIPETTSEGVDEAEERQAVEEVAEGGAAPTLDRNRTRILLYLRASMPVHQSTLPRDLKPCAMASQIVESIADRLLRDSQ